MSAVNVDQHGFTPHGPGGQSGGLPSTQRAAHPVGTVNQLDVSVRMSVPTVLDGFDDTAKYPSPMKRPSCDE